MDAWKTIIDKKKSGRCEKAAFIEVCKEIGYEGNPKKPTLLTNSKSSPTMTN